MCFIQQLSKETVVMSKQQPPLFTAVPTMQQILDFKGNRGKNSEQIIFKDRDEALAYVRQAEAFLAGLERNHRTNGQDVPLMDNLFIRTYKVPQKRKRKVLPVGQRRRFMLLGAHFDDEAVGPSGAACKAAEEGHDVYVLTFCGGSSGRADHWLNEAECQIVRLYETILGASEIGILEVHVIVDEKGLGLKECSGAVMRRGIGKWVFDLHVCTTSIIFWLII